MALPFPKMIFLAVLVFCTLSVHVSCLEEVVFVHTPDSVQFLSNDPIRSSYLGDVLSSMFAYTIRSNAEWHSLAVVTPWKRPEAMCVLQIVGCENKYDLPLEGTHFLLENLGDLDGQYDLVSHRTDERFFKPVMMHMNLGGELYESKIAHSVLLKSLPADSKKRLQLAITDPELGELIEESTFNISVPSDVKLLTELATVKELLKALSAHKADIRDGVPDIFWLKIEGLDPIAKSYGQDSFQFSEALRLLRQMIIEVKGTMRNIYDDNVVVTVIKEECTPLPLGHTGRKLLESSTVQPSPAKNYNLAVQYDPMFPVTFIILVFVSILMALAVLGISLAMWNMDPGRDSIIYRSTSTRMKKD